LKKAILIIAALMLVVSGVAAVSAYEAHIINVKAHVENALTVSGDGDMHLGTIFPEEFFITHHQISLSSSFLAVKDLEPGVPDPNARVNAVKLAIYAEEKPEYNDQGEFVGYYPWMGMFTFVRFTQVDTNADGVLNLADDDPAVPEDNWVLIGPKPNTGASPNPEVKGPITTFVLGVQDETPQRQINSIPLVIAVDAPVFEGYYNEWTDVEVKQNGLSTPTYKVPRKLPNGDDNPQHNDGKGSDWGIDIKIQVIDIFKVDVQ
jgi:hypothetical protein